VEDGVERPAGPGRRSSFRVGLAGGSQDQRSAVSEVILRVQELDTEIIDLGDEPAASEIDPTIGLLGLLLDQTDQTTWSTALRAAA
jgi:hypothetical protein